MMSKRYFILILFAAWSNWVPAQSLVFNGTIEFECKTNSHKVIKESSPEWFEMVKDRVPKYAIIYNNLTFDSSRTIYFPGKESEYKPPFWGDEGVPESYIYSDHQKNLYIAQKEVFDQTFLVTDSTRMIRWKLTNETRDIAGYECRKATTILMDSVYIMAYFTDQIVCSGGPESLHGLPGMILGVVIPRLHTTWFATKVDLMASPDQKVLVIPKKGKKSSLKELTLKLQETFKEWGKTYVISFLL